MEGCRVSVGVTFDLSDPAWQAQLQNLVAALHGSVTGTRPNGSVSEEPVEPSSHSAESTTEKLSTEITKTNRQQAAANARAAKAAKAGQTPVEDVLGPADSPEDQAPEAEDLGLADPSMSPAEAKEAGLALVRECYAAGKVAEVKALQKEWQVAKFYDVPIPRGHEFYQRVMKMAVETGIRK